MSGRFGVPVRRGNSSRPWPDPRQKVAVMRSARRSLARLVALLAVAVLANVTSSNSSATAKQSNVGPSICYHHQEVRLRKLHLVRPDLIPYPLAYEIYC